ncbi:uncharacterized protein LOC123318781 [Coccinella septempunctata]|uniref:uncharacterized protein LOC123318781 n=1 Tax=Coccinella septempunctata TaxID=41139 RepID=UPI001D086141|nr:uncharacterized protein LOC123318781 [Coccinella septempunctata]
MSNSKKKRSDTTIDKKRDIPKEKTYISKEVETSITILESPEISVVTEALLFLSKYADLKDENLIHLQKKGILPKLLMLLKKPIPIIRLSLRLVSILLTKNDAVYELDNEKYDDILLEINDMFINNPDAPTKEFCAGILAKMAKSTRIVLLIFKSDLYTPIFHLIRTSTNAVLLANVLELFYNLLDAPTAISILSTDKAFDPYILIERMKEFDPAMTKWILEIFKRLTYVSIDQIMKLLQECQLVENLFKILLEPTKAVYFPITFEIITNCLQNPITSSYFVESLEFLEFCKWSKYCSGVYLLPTAIILEKITNIPSMKQMLFDLSVEDSILYLLRSKDKKVLSIACSAISNLSTHRYCCDKMLTPVVIREILRLMELVDTTPTMYNEVAVETIHNFCKRNNRTMNLLEAYRGIDVIVKYFHAGLENIPPKTYKQILEMIILIIATPSRQQKVLTNEFFTTIIKGFQFDHEETNLLCLEIMTFCIGHKTFRDNFISMGGTEIMITLLKSTKSKTLFKNVLIFIHNNLVYKKMAEMFLNQNLVLVLKNFPEEIKEDVPLVYRCLNLLYSLFLPLKFFETGKLEVSDRFKNRFYLINQPWDFPFPCLEVLESQYMCTRKTIYLVDYRVERFEGGGSISSMNKRQMKVLKRTNSQQMSVNSKTQSEFDPFKFACDPYLLDYILYMRKHLSKDLNVEDQVKIIAIFVDAQLCGPKKDYSHPQKLHSFRLHIESLKKKLLSNIIPIGFLKVGFHCERSLLFKALCDKVCIPCTLVRGANSLYWNEVPLIRPGRNRGNLQYYVVDLMEHVGELYPVGSRDANCYCDIN